MRRLEVTFAGYWYTALTIGLGVVALVSGNNILYLIESLLLSGMIFSGILSEQSIAGVKYDVLRAPAYAEGACSDVIRVKNLKNHSLFCIELGEWRDGRFICTAFLPRIGPKAEISVSSRGIFAQRGKYEWNALAVATSYPFGLARKVRMTSGPGARWVWPKKNRGESRTLGDLSTGALQGAGQEYAEGEIRAYSFEDDCRDIVWTLSDKGSGFFVRARRSQKSRPRVVFDITRQSLDGFEKSVQEAAQPFYAKEGFAETLTIVDASGSKTFHGRAASLNELAAVMPSVDPKPRKAGSAG